MAAAAIFGMLAIVIGLAAGFFVGYPMGKKDGRQEMQEEIRKEEELVKRGKLEESKSWRTQNRWKKESGVKFS